ncbi:MAG: hypothetical protein EBQ92_08630 [Proteobacteria bacterium]|nr:hypothetical protein [Pseudomonadota bacterium]
MKNTLLATASAVVLTLLASPAFAKEYTIKEVSNYDKPNKPYYFEPSTLTIQPGDTVKFVNAQDEMHDMMVISQPKGVDEMIMSPMHEKQGDTFSYTFTVPGTYQYHCHPHEKLGMKGTIIVGKPSKPGETKKMDHHKMGKIHDDAMATEAKGATKGNGHSAPLAATPAAQGGIEATGSVKSVNAGEHTVTLVHDPIAALGWPKMTMAFGVAEGVDLSSVKAGDAVTFTLKAKGEDNYVITGIKKK